MFVLVTKGGPLAVSPERIENNGRSSAATQQQKRRCTHLSLGSHSRPCNLYFQQKKYRRGDSVSSQNLVERGKRRRVKITMVLFRLRQRFLIANLVQKNNGAGGRRSLPQAVLPTRRSLTSSSTLGDNSPAKLRYTRNDKTPTTGVDFRAATATATRRNMMSWQGHGTDLLSDALSYVGDDSADPLPKITLNAYGATGFDVANAVKNMDPTDEDLAKTGGLVHFTGSVLAFPTACFLWKVRHPQDVSLESLAPILLHQPAMEYLFIGSKEMVPPHQMLKLKEQLKAQIGDGLVVEQMDVTNAMGTFNILNGEDRLVAAALILPPNEQ